MCIRDRISGLPRKKRASGVGTGEKVFVSCLIIARSQRMEIPVGCQDVYKRQRPAWQAASEPLTPFVAARVGDDTLVARTGYTGEDGFEIVLPATEAVQLWRDLAAQGVRPAGLGARDTLRLEAGMNLYGQDMDCLLYTSP